MPEKAGILTLVGRSVGSFIDGKSSFFVIKTDKELYYDHP
jgi:hypothetical protein